MRTDRDMREAMEAHGASVLRFAFSWTRNRADSEDVYQDVFLRFATTPNEFASTDDERAWLLRVTANRCHDLARTAWHRRVSSIDALPYDPRDDAIDEEEDEASPEDLWRAVSRLPEKYRSVIHLFYVEELTGDEVARVLGISPSTARMRMKRARERLRRQLEEVDDER